MIVVACPGQGSQTPGFLAPWVEHPEARAFLEQLSESAGIDLIAHGTTSDAETIRDTAVAQPLIVAASLMSWKLLSSRVSLDTAATAGHSVGEFAAAAIAGVISYDEALRLVRERGVAMAAAAGLEASGMAAVVGGDENEVLSAIAAAGLEPANRNGGGQIVAAGAADLLATFAEHPPAGSRVIPLQVAGAFHTRFMQPAVQTLSEKASALSPNNPQRTLFTNSDGSVVTSGGQFLELLVSQVSSPVRWDACMESFLNSNTTAFVELLPGGALTGIAKRGMKGTPAVALKTPDDLEKAVELIQQAAAG